MESDINESNIYAAEMALEYLAEINEYDLRNLGEDRFKTLIDVITKNYHKKLIDIQE